MSKTIPNEVKQLAEQLFCGEPEYLGQAEGAEVYGERQGEENSPAPTGLPVLILWDGSRARKVSGTDSLALLSSL